MGESGGNEHRRDPRASRAKSDDFRPRSTLTDRELELVESKEKRAFVESLLGKEPEEVLPRIQNGDRLGIQTIVMRRLREQALILDPERAFARSLVEVAYRASSLTKDTLDADWLQSAVDAALERLVEIDAEAERDANGEVPRDAQPYQFVVQAFGTPPSMCRTATVEFNGLPHRTRFAFFVLLVDNHEVDDVLALGLWEPEELRLDIWTVFRALGHVTHEEVETFRNRKKRKR